ncbi:uncharacterized protein LOC120676835 [Panicum virgatum]|uniref:uncharacterized protein LOC120676835 n=1 Tax=Panicum virgatum TaxID=38727 RepID=UPI0019D5C495|nr:uncharacterized protein LOC120676835 [Panicum virgatum]
MLACSPELETLALIISRMTKRIHLRGQSLKCMRLWTGVVEGLAVVDAPHLERLILWKSVGDYHHMVLKIGNTIINAQTKASPSCIVPSVKILALELNFGVSKDANMLTSFLRCFPNVETLHIVSSKAGEDTGRHHAKFWLELDPIKCVKSHINKIIIHEFQGEQSEFGFVKFIAKRARKLQTLVLVLTEGTFASVGEVCEVNSQLKALTRCSWAAEGCQVLLVGPKLNCTWSFARASDLSVKDPFW